MPACLPAAAMFLPPGSYLELLSWLPSVNLPYVGQVNPSKPQVAFHRSLYFSNRKLTKTATHAGLKFTAICLPLPLQC